MWWSCPPEWGDCLLCWCLCVVENCRAEGRLCRLSSWVSLVGFLLWAVSGSQCRPQSLLFLLLARNQPERHIEHPIRESPWFFSSWLLRLEHFRLWWRREAPFHWLSTLRFSTFRLSSLRPNKRGFEGQTLFQWRGSENWSEEVSQRTINQILRGRDTCFHSKVKHCYWEKRWLCWLEGM